MANADVKFVQQFLAGAGFYDGPIDGEDSADLAVAIEQYQRRNGLVVTGQVDFATHAHMASTLRLVSGQGAPAWADQATYDEVVKRYGAAMAVYLNHPELGPLIAQAAGEGHDQTWLLARLQQTDYWQQTQEAGRAWDQLVVTDPAQAKARMADALGIVQRRAGQLGVKIAGWQAKRIAEDSIRYQWIAGTDTATLDAVLLNTVKWTPQAPVAEGNIAAAMDEVRAAAAAQLIEVSDHTAWNYAQRLLRQQVTIQGLQARFANVARARFPHLADVIDAGVTLADHVAPLRDQIARTLEVAPGTIDFNTTLWRQVLDYDDGSGRRREMTESEALTLARRQGGWARTRDANERGADLAMNLARTFGEVS